MFTILVNVNLAIFNLLPMPVLDGGQMLFATIGRLRGRALPLNFIMTAQSVFMVLLLSMIVYVSFFDVRRWARDARRPTGRPRPARRQALIRRAWPTAPPASAPSAARPVEVQVGSVGVGGPTRSGSSR